MNVWVPAGGGTNDPGILCIAHDECRVDNCEDGNCVFLMGRVRGSVMVVIVTE